MQLKSQEENMETRDGDEGYISPLGDAVVSQSDSVPELSSSVEHQRYGRTSASTWEDAWRISNGLQPLSKARFFTSAKGSVGHDFIDTIWRVLPEMKQVAAVEAKGVSITSPKNEIERMYNMGLLPTYVSMDEFVRDTVDMLTGKRSRTFSYGSNQKFVKNPSILVHGLTPAALAKFSSEFTDTGNAVLQLNQVEEMFNFHLLVEAYTFHVCVQFINFIKDYLTVYETAVMIKRSSLKTLIQVKQFFQPFNKQIAVLWAIADGQKFLSPSLLLKNLNECMLKNEEGCVSDLLRMLLRSCASAYIKYVSNWIFKGNLPKTLEFFISEQRSKLVEDRRLWTHRFSQTDDVPHYLIGMKQKIFDTGRKLVLLRQFKSNNLPRCFDEVEIEAIELLSTQEDILELMHKYRSKWDAFQEEYGYLEREVQQALLVLSDPTKLCSAEVRKEAHETFQERYQKYQLDLMVKRAEERVQKRSQLQDLMAQVSEARHRRLQAAIDEVFLLDRVSKEQTESEVKSKNRGFKLLEEYYGDLFTEIVQSLETVDVKETHQKVSLAEALVPKDVNELGANGDGEHIRTDDTHRHRAPEELSSLADLSSNVEFIAQQNEQCDSGDGPATIPSTDVNKEHTAGPQNVTEEKLFFADWSMFSKPLIPSPEEELEIEVYDGQEEFLTNRLLALSVEIPLHHQNKILDTCIIHHIVKEHYVYDHLRFLHDCVLMQNGLVVQALASSLLDLVDEGTKTRTQLMGRMWTLNNQLEKALSAFCNVNLSHLRDSLVVALRDDPETGGSPEKGQRHQAIVSGYEVLNSIVMNYHVGWPVNIILTADMLQRFQEVSTLQIRLKRTELLLAKAYKHFKTQATRSSQDSELNTYRHVMLHFVHSVQNYVNVNVIHSSWPDLTRDLSKAESFEDVHESIVVFLKNIVSNCLLGTKAKPVIKLIYDQLNIIESFCVKLVAWSEGSESVTNEKLRKREHKLLVRLYLVFMEIQKVFVGVVRTVSRKGYYPKVAHFLDVFNFNGFY